MSLYEREVWKNRGEAGAQELNATNMNRLEDRVATGIGGSYQGVWDADANDPELAEGVGTVGDFYKVSVNGTQDLGDGSVDFEYGDFVIYTIDDIWEKTDGLLSGTDFGAGFYTSRHLGSLVTTSVAFVANWQWHSVIQIPLGVSFVPTGLVYQVGGTSSGNVKCALYDSNGLKFAERAASTAQASANAYQVLAFDSSPIQPVTPGFYIASLAFSSGTATYVSSLTMGASYGGNASFITASTLDPDTLIRQGSPLFALYE
jgi:hypothetical protein